MIKSLRIKVNFKIFTNSTIRGFQMTPIDARLLDFANSGIGATMLARKYQQSELFKVG